MNLQLNYTDLRELRKNTSKIDKFKFHDVLPSDFTDFTSAYNPDVPMSTERKALDYNLNSECIDKYPPYNLINKLNGIGTRTYMESMKNTNEDLQDLENENRNSLMKKKFWFNNPKLLFKISNIKDLIPGDEQTKAERINSLMKFGLYTSIIMTIVFMDSKYILIAVVFAIITIILSFLSIGNIKISFNTNEDPPNEIIQKSQYQQNQQIPQQNQIPQQKQIPQQNQMQQPIQTEIEGQNLTAGEELLIENILKENEKKKMRESKPAAYDYYKMELDKYAKVRNNILPYNQEEIDKIKINDSQNDTSAGYDWLKASSHVNYRLSNNRFKGGKIEREKIFTDLNEAVGREIAERNTVIPAHARDVININPAEFLYGKNLDRKLYYSSH